MKVSMAGPEVMRNPGDVCEVDDAEANRLIDAGFAEAAGTKRETTSTAAPETAVQPKPAKRRPAKRDDG